MIKATYLRDDYYFNNLQECIYYYGFENDKSINDLWDLQEALRLEYEGMAYPILEELY